MKKFMMLVAMVVMIMSNVMTGYADGIVGLERLVGLEYTEYVDYNGDNCTWLTWVDEDGVTRCIDVVKYEDGTAKLYVWELVKD